MIGYHTEVDLLVKMTKDPYLIADRMKKLKHGGGSSMIDAAFEACGKILASKDYQGAGEPRKVIVIVGDGHDNASKHTRGGSDRGGSTRASDDLCRQHGRLGLQRERREELEAHG